MKKWLNNLKIRYKLLLISILSVINFVIFGFVVNYLINSGTVVTYFIELERVHYRHLVNGIYPFLFYTESNDSVDFERSMPSLDSAARLNATVANLSQITENSSQSAFVDTVAVLMMPVIGNSRQDARMTASRLRLLKWMNDPLYDRIMQLGDQSVKLTLIMKARMIAYRQNPDSATFQLIKNDIAELMVIKDHFVDTLNKLNNKLLFLSGIAIVAVIIILVLLTYLLIYVISKSITRPILKLSGDFSEIAVGNLNVKNDYDYNNEVGELSRSFRKMQQGFLDIFKQATEVTSGNYSFKVIPKSEKDELVVALNSMTETLEKNDILISNRNWLKNGQSDLNILVRGEQEVRTLAGNIIKFTCKYMPAEVGSLYVVNEESKLLELSGSYAFTQRKDFGYTFAPGEGLIGQAALEKEMVTITRVPADYTRIRSSLGDSSPACLIFIPLWHDQVLVGVMELGMLQEPGELQREFLTSVSETIAISIHTALARDKMRILLQKTQEQAEELQVQQEELRQSNEELEEQTRALKASEEALTAQQEELRVTNEELEERTRLLEKQRDDIRVKNEELEKAREEIQQKAYDLEQASRYKSEFMANMSHELRTPLNSILVLSQLMGENKAGNLNDKQIDYARTINSSGTDLLNLINDILDLSKVEAGKIQIIKEQTYISEVRVHLEQVFMPQTEKKNIGFQVEVDPSAPETISTDRLRLNQILRNLCSNAIKFTEKGQVSITICDGTPYNSRRVHPDQKPTVAFVVNDTGIGIPEEKFQKIFEAFQQADGNTNRRYGGTGLGLTISRSFAELLGGEILIESVVGSGSTFVLILPVESAGPVRQEGQITTPAAVKKEKTRQEIQSPKTEIRQQKPSAPDEAEMPVPQGTGNALLLIIEDDESMLLILQEIAQQRGFKTILSQNGETGLHFADFYKPDAILLDIGLPGINGWEVMERLRKNPKTQHIPVHIVSGAQNEHDAIEKGALGFLLKPVSKESINDAFSLIEQKIAREVRRVLVTEDDPNMRNSITELISGLEVQTTGVGSGKETLEMLRNNVFDCLILDLGLQDMNGFDLLETIRKEHKGEGPPVVVYTGKDLSREEEEKLHKYSNSIIIKGSRSHERLISEVKLFLHSMKSRVEDPAKSFGTDPEQVLKDKKILVVDDDMRNVFALTSVLEDRGMQVVVGKNGKEGIEKLNTVAGIDLVLMDIMMPEMDGYEAMRLIRKEKKWEKLPMIALTAKAMKDDRAKCIEAGANDYMSKPVDTEKLLSLLRVWLYK